MVSQIEGSGVDAPAGTAVWTSQFIAGENTGTTLPALLTSKSIKFNTTYETDTSKHTLPQTDDDGAMYWGSLVKIKTEFPVT